VLNYNISFAENHTIDALAGMEYLDAFQKGFYAGGSGAPTDDFADLQYTSTKEGLRSVDSWHAQERILSAFGRVNYDYKTKYLLSFTFREDGYSKLLGDNRWGFFPGISAGWVLSKEAFMSSYKKYISFLKLRTSYGQNGNVSGIGTYTLQGSYSSALYNQNSGYTIGSIANPTLAWEHSNTFEIGTDIGLLENRSTLNITYYNRLTADKYASIPLPESSGVTSVTSNNGSLRNKGLEIDITAKILSNNDFNWDVSANITRNTNIVEKLPYNGLERNRQGAYQVYGGNNDTLWVGGYQEGQEYGAIYAFEALGIYVDDAQVADLAGNLVDKGTGGYGSNNKVLYGPEKWALMTDAQKANGLPIQPGHIIWKDINEDGVIDDFDKVYVGSSVPKWFGGLSTTFSWKGLSLYARTDFALGYYQKDYRLPWFMGMMQGSYNTVIETVDTWTPANPNATYPKYMWADQLGYRDYARESTMFIYKANYLAFREISLSYSLPERWISVAGIKSLEISVSGQNLGYLTQSKLNIPEVSSTSTVDVGYSLPRTVIFGLNVKF
jgi:TonB-linked SusC/RagA family outer membrane protein